MCIFGRPAYKICLLESVGYTYEKIKVLEIDVELERYCGYLNKIFTIWFRISHYTCVILICWNAYYITRIY